MNESRIEKAARQLKEIRQQIATLEKAKDELNGRIVLMLRNEGTLDDKGKLRYEGEAAKFLLIEGVNRYCDPGKMKTALLGIGVTPANIAKVEAVCVKETPYSYAGVYPKPQAVEDSVAGKERKAAS